MKLIKIIHRETKSKKRNQPVSIVEERVDASSELPRILEDKLDANHLEDQIEVLRDLVIGFILRNPDKVERALNLQYKGSDFDHKTKTFVNYSYKIEFPPETANSVEETKRVGGILS